jgi:hypothetical protein
VLEAFSKAQIGKLSGDPKEESWRYSATMLAQDFRQLDILDLQERNITLAESQYHTGEASVVQLVARKP